MVAAGLSLVFREGAGSTATNWPLCHRETHRERSLPAPLRNHHSSRLGGLIFSERGLTLEPGAKKPPPPHAPLPRDRPTPLLLPCVASRIRSWFFSRDEDQLHTYVIATDSEGSGSAA